MRSQAVMLRVVVDSLRGHRPRVHSLVLPQAAGAPNRTRLRKKAAHRSWTSRRSALASHPRTFSSSIGTKTNSALSFCSIRKTTKLDRSRSKRTSRSKYIKLPFDPYHPFLLLRIASSSSARLGRRTPSVFSTTTTQTPRTIW